MLNSSGFRSLQLTFLRTLVGFINEVSARWDLGTKPLGCLFMSALPLVFILVKDGVGERGLTVKEFWGMIELLSGFGAGS